jgi:hypothetical protein
LMENKKITKEEQEKILSTYFNQCRQITRQMPENDFYYIKVNCGVCGTPRPLTTSYRCYQCTLWICAKCAGEHFGIDKAKLPKYIDKR